MSTAALAFTIEPAGTEWAYPVLAEDYQDKRPVWREVSQTFLDQALDAMPPIYGPGGSFMVGEAYTHGPDGTVYAGFVEMRGRCFARYTTRKTFGPEISELAKALGRS